jgi:signal transduction histidine kinase
MLDRLVARFGPSYILWMMIVTRLCGLVGGALVVYYVGLTLDLSETLRFHWSLVATVVVLVAVTVTVLLALAETRALRTVLERLRLGRGFEVELGRQAGREAVAFPVRHHLREAVLVPMCCLPPVYVYLPWAAGAPLIMLVHITIATLMGVGAAVSVAYFTIQELMKPVTRHLLAYRVEIDYENLPNSRLFSELLFPFTLTVVITATMITTLATQKAGNLVHFPGEPEEVVRSLRNQTIAISACAVLMSLLISTFIARSVSVPVQEMVRAMRRVEAGFLTERIAALSTNEIGMLGRSFNRMVQRLEENQNLISELNAGLERKVRERTQELESALAELKLAQDRLVHTEKMTSLGGLVAGIAHEINNSINAVYNGIIPLRQRIEQLAQGVAGALSEPPATGSEAAPAAGQMRASLEFVLKLAQVVEGGARRTADIVRDLKKFAHPGQGQRAWFDVHEGLDIALNLLDNKLRGRVTVEKSYCADGKVLCSGTELTQVFLNVLDNAQQAIAGSGSIRIGTERTGQSVVVRIRDSGCGIPHEIQKRIFDPFFTTKDVGVGTGLGLSISYGIVRGHGGSIDVRSPPEGGERGTEFAITLPLRADTAEERRTAPPASAPAAPLALGEAAGEAHPALRG